MKETEKRLREEVRRLLEQAEAVDEEEDARYGRDRRGDELPAELARRETRIQKIREAKRALEERARAEAESKEQPPQEGKPKAKDQFNFTDPESRIMQGPDRFLQAYNTQIKQVRGFRQFLLRGLQKVQGEWSLICLTHNILKLHRICYG
jgi:hypothetical protein